MKKNNLAHNIIASLTEFRYFINIDDITSSRVASFELTCAKNKNEKIRSNYGIRWHDAEPQLVVWSKAHHQNLGDDDRGYPEAVSATTSSAVHIIIL